MKRFLALIFLASISCSANSPAPGNPLPSTATDGGSATDGAAANQTDGAIPADASVNECAAVTCNTPPMNDCLDPSTARTYATSGTCSAGACSYMHTDTVCMNGCQNALCTGNDPCNGITCNSPPVASCTNATTQRSYAASGTCSNGACSYTPTDTPCTAAPANATPSCTGGACGFTCNAGFTKSGASCSIAVAPMPTARNSLAATLGTDGRIYAIGGNQGGGYLATVEAYDPATNTWATHAHMPTGRDSLAAATGFDGRIYAIGGVNLNSSLNHTILTTVEAYTPTTDTWASVASLPAARAGCAAVTGSDGRVYVFGGIDASSHAQTVVEIYDPTTNSWSFSASAMLTGRSYLAAAVGPNGTIYTIGGEEVTSALATVEAYSVSSNSWTTVPSMPTARYALTAATGQDGRIYAFAGETSSTAASSTVEAYDPTTSAWATATNLAIPRAGAAAVTANNGQIYVIGGYVGGSVTASVEAYTP